MRWDNSPRDTLGSSTYSEQRQLYNTQVSCNATVYVHLPFHRSIPVIRDAHYLEPFSCSHITFFIPLTAAVQHVNVCNGATFSEYLHPEPFSSFLLTVATLHTDFHQTVSPVSCHNWEWEGLGLMEEEPARLGEEETGGSEPEDPKDKSTKLDVTMSNDHWFTPVFRLGFTTNRFIFSKRIPTHTER